MPLLAQCLVAVVLYPALALGRLGTGLGEVEDEGAARKREPVAIVECVEETSRFVRCLTTDGPITLRALQVEFEEKLRLAPWTSFYNPMAPK
jgi:hypothetical protein